MYTKTVQFTINVKDKSGNNYNVELIDPNELCAVQELLKYRSTWFNIIGGYRLNQYDVYIESKNHLIYVNAQLQIDAPQNINMEMIIENGKNTFNHHLSAEHMLLSNGDTIGMTLL
jgi:hypothetical protein